MQATASTLKRFAARRNASIVLLVGLCALLLPLEASAINCRATIAPLVFGTYMPMTAVNLDVAGNISIRCMGQPGSFSVLIGPGISGDQTDRTLVGTAAGVLHYNLYLNAGRGQIWGDGNGPTFTASGVRSGNGRPTNYDYPIYGRIFSNQDPAPGTYSDNVLVTLLF